jgi:predicted O-methyltransferase YrrM
MNVIELNISRRVGLLDLFNEKGFKTGVEVGTDQGEYAEDIILRMPEVKLTTIDPWTPFTEGDEVLDAEKIEERYRTAETRLSPYPNCTILRMTSMEAVRLFPDNFFDFVFIDGNHTFDHVYEDIFEWTKKVKPGGVVAGHDYVRDVERDYGVIEAVNDYVNNFSIDPLFILKRGSFVPCWMFYKK